MAATSLCCGNIKAAFLPPNVTALLQPMDQGVLQNVKCSYRKMLLRKLIESDGCEDATEHTVTDWLSCDTEANQLYRDEEIISLVQNKPQYDSDLKETDEPENVLVSYSQAANALEIALRYIVQNENATSTDIMFMRRWHNIASTSRITSLRQTNFFTLKDR
ncbi:hypothetical protein AVEN_247460-1 [Araneus ventricosus]|uniref:DDE-1 domain-containing protein n=1 Tax=Araneus ventricosus TaxID=182803 RepID=A0A4Y2RQR7_ARAVE|nr:hypothetical protein AVEN_247460-1 [Araneus ventricosus]